MKLADSFRLSINSVLHRQLRAWLTLLGIVIGVAAVISIISIGEGAQASVASRLSNFGADVVTLSAGFSRGSSFGGQFREPPSGGGGFDFGGGTQSSSRKTTSTSTVKTPTLTKRDVAVIEGNPDVLYVNQIVSGRGTLYFMAEQTSVTIQGVNPLAWAKVSTVSLASGRLLTPSDASAVVIGDRVANKVFKQPITLGRKVTIEDKIFTVVGILKASGTSGFGGGGNDSIVYMPYSSVWDTLPEDTNRDVFSSIQIKVSDAGNVDSDVNAISDALIISRRVTANTKDFTITSEAAIQEQISSVTETLTAFLAAIAAVSLLVGAVGIANSMFTSVLEKTKEIGILKALGSTNGEILKLFVIESGLFGLIGGIIGAIFGMIGAFFLTFVGIGFIPGMGSSSGGMNTLVTPQLVIGAILLSTIIGMVAGFFPARSAAKLRPVDALRYE